MRVCHFATRPSDAEQVNTLFPTPGTADQPSLRSRSTADEAAAFIATTRKQHWSASHNSSAFRVGPNASEQRSSDDGGRLENELREAGHRITSIDYATTSA